MSDDAQPADTGLRNKILWRVSTAVVAVGVLASAYVTFGGDAEPSAPAADQPSPTWKATTPKNFGDPVLAQESDGKIAVTSHNGVTVFDSRTGKSRWQHRLPAKVLHNTDGELGGQAAAQAVTVAGDTLLTREWASEKEPGVPTKITGFDLETGEERFAVKPDAGHQMSEAVTASTLAVSQCDADKVCELTGYDLSDGKVAWRLDRDVDKTALTFPAPVTDGAPLLEPTWFPALAVTKNARAIINERNDDDLEAYDVTSIDLNSGETTRWQDKVGPDDDLFEYWVMGEHVLRRREGEISLMDSASGDKMAKLSLQNDYGNTLPPQFATLTEDDTLLDVKPADDSGDLGDGAASYQLVDLENGKALSGNKVDGLVLGAADGTVVTVTGTEHTSVPVMHGFDAADGEQTWKRRMYPAAAEAEGLSSLTATLAHAEHLALTSSPNSYDTDYIRGSGQTRIVSLADGDTTIIDNVRALSLGDKGMLGQVLPPEGDDGKRKARLAFYAV